MVPAQLAAVVRDFVTQFERHLRNEDELPEVMAGSLSFATPLDLCALRALVAHAAAT